MIGAQQVVDIALGAADPGVETTVLVTDRADASLRWAGNSMTTNGEAVSRTTTVISVVRKGDKAHVGSVRSSEVDPAIIPDLVAAAEQAARSAPEARDAAPALPPDGVPADWDAAVPQTGAQAFGHRTRIGARVRRR